MAISTDIPSAGSGKNNKKTASTKIWIIVAIISSVVVLVIAVLYRKLRKSEQIKIPLVNLTQTNNPAYEIYGGSKNNTDPENRPQYFDVQDGKTINVIESNKGYIVDEKSNYLVPVSNVQLQAYEEPSYVKQEHEYVSVDSSNPNNQYEGLSASGTIYSIPLDNKNYVLDDEEPKTYGELEYEELRQGDEPKQKRSQLRAYAIPNNVKAPQEPNYDKASQGNRNETHSDSVYYHMATQEVEGYC
eukprot:m.4353 g.4353  ORF g.4353 m.4353 type:complete len:244 (+) comp2964_c0_seq1:95-826(+)